MVEEVVHRLHSARLQGDIKKSMFDVEVVDYLGVVMQAGVGVKIDPRKIEAISHWRFEDLRSRSAIKSFLGLCNYVRIFCHSLQADRERARAAQEAAKSSTSGIKVRKDYVPAAQQAKSRNVNTSICPYCRQSIPNDEMSEHLRIEMLDPQWREQSKVAAQRSSTTNLSTADVATNLKRLASQRADVFDLATGRTLTVEEQERLKRPNIQADPPGPAPTAAAQTLPPGRWMFKNRFARFTKKLAMVNALRRIASLASVSERPY